MGTASSSASRPDESTTTSVMPLMLTGGLVPSMRFSSPIGTSARGLVRYQ